MLVRVGEWGWRTVAAVGLAVVAVVVARAFGPLGAGVPALSAVVLMMSGLRIWSVTPSGGPGGPRPPDAGVREPRRPLPRRPAGAMAMPIPAELPEDAVALGW